MAFRLVRSGQPISPMSIDHRLMQSNIPRYDACCNACGQTPVLPRVIAWLQWITIAWMTLECGASLWAAFRAQSVALLAFGSDSLIELLSAIVVLLQFVPRFSLKKMYAHRAAAVLLFALAGVVVCIASLGLSRQMKTSTVGIAVTALALVIMPVLAWMKRRRMNNRALAADAMQSATCAYLAAVTLSGLVILAEWRIRWVDTVAALAAMPVLLVEGRRAWRGDGCGCA
jgi:divalent metal cation (Fe/Co/Zn/Cd) transporter